MVISLVLSTDEVGIFESRIEALDSTRVEDMVREYFAKADEVGLLVCYFCVFIFFRNLSAFVNADLILC